MVYDMSKGGTPYLQSYLVPLTTGAAYLARVMAAQEDGEAEARRAAELAGAAPAWGPVANMPQHDAEEPGVDCLKAPARPAPAAPIGHGEAAEIAAQWGSLMRAGDPGAIFYTFPGGDSAPDWGPHDRAAALAYCDSCLAIARARGEELDSDSVCPDCGRDYGGEELTACPVCAEDVAELESLRAYIVAGASSFDQPPAPRYTLQSLQWLKEDAEEEGRPLRAFSFILTRDVTESQCVTAFGFDAEEAEEAARAIAEARPDAWAVDDGNAWDSPYTNGSGEEEDAAEELAAAEEEARRAEGGRA